VAVWAVRDLLHHHHHDRYDPMGMQIARSDGGGGGGSSSVVPVRLSLVLLWVLRCGLSSVVAVRLSFVLFWVRRCGLRLPSSTATCKSQIRRCS